MSEMVYVPFVKLGNKIESEFSPFAKPIEFANWHKGEFGISAIETGKQLEFKIFLS
jgi:hypothetical protein